VLAQFFPVTSKEKSWVVELEEELSPDLRLDEPSRHEEEKSRPPLAVEKPRLQCPPSSREPYLGREAVKGHGGREVRMEKKEAMSLGQRKTTTRRPKRCAISSSGGAGMRKKAMRQGEKL